jgi:probable O-glycosylation ligase (exosortase A-associated)
MTLRRRGRSGSATPPEPSHVATNDSTVGGRRSTGGVRESAVRAAILAPCIFYLVIEFARPATYVPIIELFRLGMWASVWGFATMMGRGAFRSTKPVRLLLGFLALIALQVVLARNNRHAFDVFYTFAVLILGSVLPLALLPRNLSEVRILVAAYFALHLPTAIHGVFNSGVGVGGWIEDENDLAFALLAALGVGMYLLFATTGAGRRVVAALILAVTVTCIFCTRSRGGFLGLMGEITYLLAVGPQRKKIVAVLVVAGVLAFLFVPDTYWKRMQTIETSSDNHDDSGYERILSWKIGWRIFKDHPILGVGSQNYPNYAGPYGDAMRKEMYVTRHLWGRAAHSLYVTLLAEQGTVGTALFVLLLGWYFRAARRIRRKSASIGSEENSKWATALASGLDAAMIGALASGTFITVIYYPVIWVLVGLMAGLDRVVSESVVVPAPVSQHDSPSGRGRLGALAATRA